MVNPSFQNFPAQTYPGHLPVSPSYPGFPYQGLPGYNYPSQGMTMGGPSTNPPVFGANFPYTMGQNTPGQSPGMMGNTGHTGWNPVQYKTSNPYATLPKTSTGLPNAQGTKPLTHASQPIGYPGTGSSTFGMGTTGTGMGTSGMSPTGSFTGTTGMGIPGMGSFGTQVPYEAGMGTTPSPGMPQSGIPFMQNPQGGMMSPASFSEYAHGNSGLMGPGQLYGEPTAFPRTKETAYQVSASGWKENENQRATPSSPPVYPEAYGFPSEDGFRWHSPSQEITNYDYSI